MFPETSRSARRHALLLPVACLALACAATAQPRYTLTDLGALPGTTASLASGLNDRGDVVGSCSATGDFSDAVGFVWRNGVMTSTGRLPKGTYSHANAINNTGVAVGGGDTGNGRPQAWVRPGSGLVNFFSNNGGNTHAIAINDSGAICGYYTKSLSGWQSSWKAAIWTPNPKDPRKYNTTVLPVLVGLDPTSKATTAIPAAFNRSGLVVGYAANEVIGQHACLWNNDAAHSIVDLGVFPGDGSSLANAINDHGQVVGQSHPPFGSRPVAWNADASHSIVELPLPAGDNYGAALLINNLGHIVGTSAQSEPGTWNIGPGEYVLWRDGGVFTIPSLLDASGDGWTLSAITGINHLGQIAGSATFQGRTRAIVLTPAAE